MFEGAGVNIVDGGHRDLGAAIGAELFVKKYLEKKLDRWVAKVETLSVIAKTQPHAAHAGYIHGLKNVWSFAQRTMATLGKLIHGLETAIRTKFIPALLNKEMPISDKERQLFALPARLSGLGIANPVLDSPFELADSLAMQNSQSANLEVRTSAKS